MVHAYNPSLEVEVSPATWDLDTKTKQKKISVKSCKVLESRATCCKIQITGPDTMGPPAVWSEYIYGLNQVDSHPGGSGIWSLVSLSYIVCGTGLLLAGAHWLNGILEYWILSCWQGSCWLSSWSSVSDHQGAYVRLQNTSISSPSGKQVPWGWGIRSIGKTLLGEKMEFSKCGPQAMQLKFNPACDLRPRESDSLGMEPGDSMLSNGNSHSLYPQGRTDCIQTTWAQHWLWAC